MKRMHKIIGIGLIGSLAVILFGGYVTSNKERNISESMIKEEKTVTVFDVMNITLSNGMTTGDFDIYLEQGGGIPILNSDGKEVGIIGTHRITEGIFDNSELVGVDTHENHAVFTTEFEKVDTVLPGVIAKYSRDHGEHQDLWYAFWAKEGMEPVYAISLYDQYFNYDEAIDFVESVTFLEEAFAKPAEDVIDEWGQQFTN